MADASNREGWKKIAEQIQHETDSAKLAQLVRKLCEAFDKRLPAEQRPSTAE